QLQAPCSKSGGGARLDARNMTSPSPGSEARGEGRSSGLPERHLLSPALSSTAWKRGSSLHALRMSECAGGGIARSLEFKVWNCFRTWNLELGISCSS